MYACIGTQLRIRLISWTLRFLYEKGHRVTFAPTDSEPVNRQFWASHIEKKVATKKRGLNKAAHICKRLDCPAQAALLIFRENQRKKRAAPGFTATVVSCNCTYNVYGTLNEYEYCWMTMRAVRYWHGNTLDFRLDAHRRWWQIFFPFTVCVMVKKSGVLLGH